MGDPLPPRSIPATNVKVRATILHHRGTMWTFLHLSNPVYLEFMKITAYVSRVTQYIQTEFTYRNFIQNDMAHLHVPIGHEKSPIILVCKHAIDTSNSFSGYVNLVRKALFI